jgi:hypothetical protein
VALAEYRFLQNTNRMIDDVPVLDQRDFESVANITFQFKQYLINVHGLDEDDRAYYNEARALDQNFNAAGPGSAHWGSNSHHSRSTMKAT